MLVLEIEARSLIIIIIIIIIINTLV